MHSSQGVFLVALGARLCAGDSSPRPRTATGRAIAYGPLPPTMTPTLPNARPPASSRRFVSPLVEGRLKAAAKSIRDPNVRQLFTNTWPNTLDTTVFDFELDLEVKEHELSQPVSWIITGDSESPAFVSKWPALTSSAPVPASWLRDSANQVSPYLTVLKSQNHDDSDWIALYRLLLGTVYAQAKCILHSPFSNAFIPPSSTVKNHNSDRVNPSPPRDKAGKLRVWESKWELDTLVSFLDLSTKLAHFSDRVDFVHSAEWREAVQLVLKIFQLQQRGTAEEVHIGSQPRLSPIIRPRDPHRGRPDRKRYDGPDGIYRFQRSTQTASETRPLNGLGEPARRCG